MRLRRTFAVAFMVVGLLALAEPTALRFWRAGTLLTCWSTWR